MLTRTYFVYILASGRNGTLYIGVTDNLVRRMIEHREKAAEGFTQKYSIGELVYYEVHADINQAIIREKQLKKWRRAWKTRQIEERNPYWVDLFRNGEIIAMPMQGESE
ncbi:MAG TPA: GIY-YIG nuclease family protein [Bacteroidota bacterium]|nr:GIY-YIG nuclease family protein [Bacteroidota bacterium]